MRQSNEQHCLSQFFNRSSFLLIGCFILMGIAGCSGSKPHKDLLEVAGKQQEQCQQLTADGQRLCRDVINGRLANYAAYVERSWRMTRSSISRRESLLVKASAADGECKKGNKEACHKADQLRVKANELSQRNRKTQLNQEIAWARTKKAVAGTSSLVSRRKTKAGIICEVKGDGRVVCVRLTSLLAFYNNEMGAAILQDINRLPEVFEMDPGARAVMHCGSGVWGTEDLLGDDTYASIFGENGESSEGEAAESGDAPYTSEAEGVAEPSGSISSETAKRVNDQCLKLQKKVADSMPERGTSPGFTGMTGIDSLESSICGMEITSGPGSDFTEQALKQIEIFSESCDTNVIESMMDADKDVHVQSSDNNNNKPRWHNDNHDNNNISSGNLDRKYNYR
jgi:hypothetical protein